MEKKNKILFQNGFKELYGEEPTDVELALGVELLSSPQKRLITVGMKRSKRRIMAVVIKVLYEQGSTHGITG